MSGEEEIADEATPEGAAAAAPTRRPYGAVEGAEEGLLFATAETHLDVCTEARADGFDQLIDVTAVDYLTYGAPRHLPEGVEAERFEVVTQLIDHARRRRVRIRTQVAGDEPVVASVFDLWPGCENLEREVFDMFGIQFEGHPDMSRVLMPEDWVGHPLRKDYAVGAIPVQFKAASNER